jgi:hypothetical protein
VPEHRPPAWAVVLHGGLAIAALHALIPADAAGKPVLYLGLLVVSVGLLAHRVLLTRPVRWWPWGLLLAGVAVYAGTTAGWYRAIRWGPPLPFPSVVDAGYFVAYALVGAFLVMAVTGRARHALTDERATALLDAGLITPARPRAAAPRHLDQPRP